MLEKNTPTYDEETHTVTLPSVQYVQWEVDGKPAKGNKVVLKEGQEVEVEAIVEEGVRVGGSNRQRKFSFKH